MVGALPAKEKGDAAVAPPPHSTASDRDTEPQRLEIFMTEHTTSSAEERSVQADLVAAAQVAAATISAVYEWVDRVNATGGTTSLSGIAACHAMINSLEKNRARVERLVMAPVRAAISKTEGR
jgi:hypothetical protein